MSVVWVYVCVWGYPPIFPNGISRIVFFPKDFFYDNHFPESIFLNYFFFVVTIVTFCFVLILLTTIKDKFNYYWLLLKVRFLHFYTLASR